jgi:hypothetical protein
MTVITRRCLLQPGLQNALQVGDAPVLTPTTPRIEVTKCWRMAVLESQKYDGVLMVEATVGDECNCPT